MLKVKEKIQTGAELLQVQNSPLVRNLLQYHGGVLIPRDMIDMDVVTKEVTAASARIQELNAVQETLNVESSWIERNRILVQVRAIRSNWIRLNCDQIGPSIIHCHPGAGVVHFLYNESRVKLLAALGSDARAAFNIPFQDDRFQSVLARIAEGGGFNDRDLNTEVNDQILNAAVSGDEALLDAISSSMHDFGLHVQRELRQPLDIDVAEFATVSIREDMQHARDLRNGPARNEPAAFRQCLPR